MFNAIGDFKCADERLEREPVFTKGEKVLLAVSVAVFVASFVFFGGKGAVYQLFGIII